MHRTRANSGLKSVEHSGHVHELPLSQALRVAGWGIPLLLPPPNPYPWRNLWHDAWARCIAVDLDGAGDGG